MTDTVDHVTTTPGPSSGAVLSVTDLSVRIPTEDGTVQAVRGVSFSIGAGQVLGVVGESGSGKSITALSIMGLQPRHAQVTGSIRFNGKPIANCTDDMFCCTVTLCADAFCGQRHSDFAPQMRRGPCLTADFVDLQIECPSCPLWLVLELANMVQQR